MMNNFTEMMKIYKKFYFYTSVLLQNLCCTIVVVFGKLGETKVTREEIEKNNMLD